MLLCFIRHVKRTLGHHPLSTNIELVINNVQRHVRHEIKMKQFLTSDWVSVYTGTWVHTIPLPTRISMAKQFQSSNQTRPYQFS